MDCMMKLKKRVVRLLAASMVLTMLVPSLSVYAVEDVKILFNTGEGPKAAFKKPDSPDHMFPYTENELVGLKGQSSRFITDTYGDLELQFIKSLPRPWFPQISAEWRGYLPETENSSGEERVQWYDPDGNRKISCLPCTFPVDDITYEMKWKGDSKVVTQFLT